MGLTIYNNSIVPTSLWLIFTVSIIFLLIIDLKISSKLKDRKIANWNLLECGFWIVLALLFNFAFAFFFGNKLGLEFLTGYLVEKSLSIDNLFAILMIFEAFQIEKAHQHRVLFFGILGAIVFRGIFILSGSILFHKFHWIQYVFGFLLVLTAVKISLGKNKDHSFQESGLVRYVRKLVPSTISSKSGKFLIIENQKLKATPILFALIIVEFTDLVFALDSIPAVFAVTQDSFVAFSSNIFAILGLRAIFFLITPWISRLNYLKIGLAFILGFIGLKMLLTEVIQIPSWLSLAFIVFILFIVALDTNFRSKPKPNI